jgi:hypothetical protein
MDFQRFPPQFPLPVTVTLDSQAICSTVYGSNEIRSILGRQHGLTGCITSLEDGAAPKGNPRCPAIRGECRYSYPCENRGRYQLDQERHH